MTMLAFDTLKIADRLQAGGFTAEQARTVAAVLGDGLDVATTADIAALGKDLRGEVAALGKDLRGEMKDLELRLIRWMLGVAAAATVVIIGAIGGIVRLMLP